MSNRTVWCWGSDGGDHDRLGDGSTGMDRHVPVAVSNVEGVSDLAVGFWHACAAQSDGRVRCWGQNASNELGTGCTSGCAQIDGSSEVAEITGAIRVAAGSGSSCAVRGEARELWCWGFNPSSQLGFTSAEIRAVASPVRDGSMDVTGVELVEGGGGQNFQNADTSGFRGHLCAIREGTLWCWGANDRGQSSDDAAVMVAPTPLTALADVTSVSVGNRHTCAIYSGGLTCWGNNDSGQLGFAGGDRRGPRAGPILGLPHPAVSVAAGADHTCAALSDDSVWCWGDNAQRQLGSAGASTATPTEVPL
jgi:alpha-tubulin suppressor-like RCC1 family protein